MRWGKGNKQSARSRPVIPQRPSNVFSYYSSGLDGEGRGARNTEAFAQKRRPRGWWVRHTPSILAAAAIAICFLYVLGVDPSPKVIQVSSTSVVPLYREAGVYQEAARTIISGSLLNYNKLTIDRQKVARELKGQFPELATAEVSLPLMGRRPVIHIAPKAPALILTSQQGGFVVDEQGVAIADVSKIVRLDKSNLPIVEDVTGVELEAGRAVLPASDVKFIREISRQFSNKGLTISSLSLPAVASELHVKLEGLQYYIKFDMLGDARQQAGTLFAVQQRLQAEGKLPAEYIDVRVHERAYYK